MKKIFALALAIVMMMAIALPTFADVKDSNAVAAGGVAESHKYGDATGTVAAPENQDVTGDNMLIKYGVNQEYLVTIPADVNFGFLNNATNKFEDTRNVKAENIVISGNEWFTMSVVSAHKWQMVDQDPGASVNVDYSAKLDDPRTEAKADAQADTGYVTFTNATANEEELILVVNPAEGNKGWDKKATGNVDIKFTTAGTAQEGTYLDTLTFKVAIVDTTPYTQG